MGFGEIKRAYSDGVREEILAAYAADPNEKKSSGETLLHYACSYADAEAVEYLLGVGLSPNAKDSSGRTPLHFLARQINVNSRNVPVGATHKCAVCLLEAGASAIRKDEDGITALMLAAQLGRYELVEAIVKSGGRLTLTDHQGNNALHIACRFVKSWVNGLSRQNHEDRAEAELIMENYFLCVKALAESGLDIDEKNNAGETPRVIAVKSGAKKIAAFLDGTLGTDTEALSAGGMTLHEAVEKGDCEAIRALAESGCSLNEVVDEGEFRGLTPLGIACYTVKPEVVKLLLALGASPNLKNAEGKVAIAPLFEYYGGNRYFTLDSKSPIVIFHLLVEAGMDKDVTINDDSDTILMGACRKTVQGLSYNVYFALTEALIEFGVDPNHSDLMGQTPLMVLCQSNRSIGDLPLLLLEAGADVNAVDKAGNTPLHYAAMNRSSSIGLEMAQFLFDFDFTSAEVANNDGKTALDLAVDGNNEPLVKLILTNA